MKLYLTDTEYTHFMGEIVMESDTDYAGVPVHLRKAYREAVSLFYLGYGDDDIEGDRNTIVNIDTWGQYSSLHSVVSSVLTNANYDAANNQTLIHVCERMLIELDEIGLAIAVEDSVAESKPPRRRR